MKKLISNFILLVVLLLAKNAFAANSVPQFPADCFTDDATYCAPFGVDYSDELGRDVIRINFFAKLDGGDLEDVQDILDLFLDFNAWGEDYTSWVENFGSISTDKKAKKSAKKALEEGDVTMLFSEEDDSAEVEMEDGTDVYVHHTAYFTKGPWPFTAIKIQERSFYYEIPTYEGAEISYVMDLDPSYEDLEGLKYKKAVLHIGYDEEEEVYNLYFTMDVIPEIDLLPTVAAPYVAGAFISVFEGMFADFL